MENHTANDCVIFDNNNCKIKVKSACIHIAQL